LTNRERFQRVLRFEPVDRLPITEWAPWWDKTVRRWHNEGLPSELTNDRDIRDYFGLDQLYQFWIGPAVPPAPSHGAGVVSTNESYEAIKDALYQKDFFDLNQLTTIAKRQSTGEMAVWLTLQGFFWYPRDLFGIENHLFAFYDQPELMHRMNEDLLQFNLRVLDEFSRVCVPEFMTFAEDMSYNHGPMLSKDQFDEFMAPYYRRIVPEIVSRGIIPFVDTDGDVTVPAAWFEEVGIEGLLPLERMAGVDVNELRRNHPKLKMIGAFDKTTMHLGEERMRQEFERLLPVMQSGGFIPGCDHQTPPEVSLEDYRLYLKLLREYCELAATGI
jgi:hypothetical protein